MKTKLIFIFSVFAFQLKAQDPHFSEFYSASIQLNPALAGSFQYPTFTIGFRDQWPNLTGNFKSGMVSYNQFMNKINLGMGGYYLIDAGNGTVTTHSLHLDFARSLFSMAGGTDFILGVEASYQYRKINLDGLTFGDDIDPRYGFVYPTTNIQTSDHKSSFDFAGGFLISDSKYNIGFSIHHFTQPDQSFVSTVENSLPAKYSLHGSYKFSILSEEGNYISPSVLFLKQGDTNEQVYALSLLYNHFMMGMGIRSNDALLFAIGIDNERCRISYCYDYTTSALTNLTGGSHEIFLSFFIVKEKLKNGKTFKEQFAF